MTHPLTLRHLSLATLLVLAACSTGEANFQDDAAIYDEANFGDHDHVHPTEPPSEDMGTIESALTGTVPVGTRLYTTDALNLRTGPSTAYAVIRVIPMGAAVTVAQSTPSNGYYKVTYSGSTGWAHGNWLTTGAGTVYVSGGPVSSNAQSFANSVCSTVGACTISTYEGHHPSRARALDILASSAYGVWPSSWAFGDSIAQHALNNMGRFNIWYVIWRQRINYGDGRGWQGMGDRGSITANHYDHVHVSFW